MKKGFTLVEVLVVVLIVGILTSLALPNYKRSVERSRATEAMNIVKSANDAVYAYAAERGQCPQAFSKLLITIPGTKVSDTQINGKYFSYHLNAATNARIPATDCGGVVAERLDGSYKIWNPYKVIDSKSKKRTLACTGNVGLCKALGLYPEDGTVTPY